MAALPRQSGKTRFTLGCFFVARSALAHGRKAQLEEFDAMVHGHGSASDRKRHIDSKAFYLGEPAMGHLVAAIGGRKYRLERRIGIWGGSMSGLLRPFLNLRGGGRA